MAVNTTRFPLRSAHPRSATARRSTQQARPSDDEILGLDTAAVRRAPVSASAQNPVASAAPPAAHSYGLDARGASPYRASGTADGTASASNGAAQDADAAGIDTADSAIAPAPELAQILDAHPQLRAAWDAAQQFQTVFATPAAAQDAKSQLDELDELFFSADPSAQAALAARIHGLSPEAFHSLAHAMQMHAAQVSGGNSEAVAGNSTLPGKNGPEIRPDNSGLTLVPQAAVEATPGLPGRGEPRPYQEASTSVRASDDAAKSSTAALPQTARPHSPDLQGTAARAAQVAFFHSANSAAVHQVLAAIESQVAHLLPSSVSAPTKTRMVGEIYRDLASALGANRQLGHQLREAFRSGAGDAMHQRAIVSLIAGRARQALPSIARRVINEWTHEVVAANQERLSRQNASAKRVDISGARSSDGVNRRPVSPREVDYKRLSDADILNL